VVSFICPRYLKTDHNSNCSLLTSFCSRNIITASEIVVEGLDSVSSAELRVAEQGSRGFERDFARDFARAFAEADDSVQAIPYLSYHTPMLRLFFSLEYSCRLRRRAWCRFPKAIYIPHTCPSVFNGFISQHNFDISHSFNRAAITTARLQKSRVFQHLAVKHRY
jgi:hypothetical protein